MHLNSLVYLMENLSFPLKTDEKEVVNSDGHEDATCPKPEHL